jgi:hypothetical protein
MGPRSPADVALGSLRTDSARWSDESPDEIEIALGDMIRGYPRGRRPRAMLLRMHPDAWGEIKAWVRNVCSRWPETCHVKVVCNPDQDRRSISLSDTRLTTDTKCQRRRSSARVASSGGDGPE